MKAATFGVLDAPNPEDISIHAAREGGDLVAGNVSGIWCISIHAAREGGDYAITGDKPQFEISIHAAREGGDRQAWRLCLPHTISIHAAREGGDGFGMSRLSICGHFNPRRP